MFTADVYRVLIASPSDLKDEREHIPKVVQGWTNLNALSDGVVLLPVRWETHSVPELGGRPQGIINRQLVESSDVLVGAFWTRIGTATGVAESGTIEEINEFRDAGKPVLLYFSSIPVVPGSVDPQQLGRLVEFRDQIREEGLYEEYSSIPELTEKLNRHLTETVRRLRENQSAVLEAGPKNPEGRVGEVRDEASAVMERFRAEWTAERDSDPMNTQEGKQILRRLGLAWLDFRQVLQEALSDEEMAALDSIVKDSKAIQNHQTYLDGGVSFGEFCEAGDLIIDKSVALSHGEL